MAIELSQPWANQFVALIMDNEVTVGEFVTTPPVPWSRLMQRNGILQIAEGCPTLLTSKQAKFEMINWDEVSLTAIVGALEELGGTVDYVLYGSNACLSLPHAMYLLQNVGSNGEA